MIEAAICILGWLVYQLFSLTIVKNEIDKTDEVFDFKKYTVDNWDDWLFTFVAAIGLLLISKDIFIFMVLHFAFMENMFWSNKIPFLIGAFGGYIFEYIYDILKIIGEKIKKKLK